MFITGTSASYTIKIGTSSSDAYVADVTSSPSGASSDLESRSADSDLESPSLAGPDLQASSAEVSMMSLRV